MNDETPWSTHRNRLVRLCATLGGEPTAAEDLAQETLLIAWRLRDRLVDPSGTSAWLDAIARNVCHRHRTRRARRLVRERQAVVEAVTETGPDPLVQLLERDELVELLDRALSLLPADTREALVARYVDELTPTEIAARCGTSADSVSMRLVRGRTKLRHLLEDELRDEPAAAVWTGRHGAAWRPTRLRCQVCATAGIEHRRDRRRGMVELRCPRCSPEIASAFALDNPTQGPLLEGVVRPGAVVARMAAWSASYWTGDGTGTVACTRCGNAVERAAYVRDDMAGHRSSRGWKVDCAHCAEQQTISLTGVALAQQETRELRARRPDAVAVPVRREERDGRAIEVVGFRDDASAEGVDVLFSTGPDARLLAVVTG
ncbi:RNA polymerase sigma factor [Nocardioides bigeumensis]|uniref:RNA polymerase sigma factor n=1 Tax=Nocardioides bigeumensis TaxID=433657 RepID=A0ABN2YEN6_9ACTN